MEQGRTFGNNSNVQAMIKYKGFTIKKYTSHQSTARVGEWYIQYPDGKVSIIAVGSEDAAKRIIDTHEKVSVWDALDAILVPKFLQKDENGNQYIIKP